MSWLPYVVFYATLLIWTQVHFFITEFSMTTISMKSSKADIINEAVPLIEGQAEQIQDLKEKLNAAFILLGLVAATAAIF